MITDYSIVSAVDIVHCTYNKCKQNINMTLCIYSYITLQSIFVHCLDRADITIFFLLLMFFKHKNKETVNMKLSAVIYASWSSNPLESSICLLIDLAVDFCQRNKKFV